MSSLVFFRHFFPHNVIAFRTSKKKGVSIIIIILAFSWRVSTMEQRAMDDACNVVGLILTRRYGIRSNLSVRWKPGPRYKIRRNERSLAGHSYAARMHVPTHYLLAFSLSSSLLFTSICPLPLREIQLLRHPDAQRVAVLTLERR